MDGGEEEDETKRDFVEIAPPVVQPYVEREIQLAIHSNRHPREGSAAYRDVPLTGAFQSSFPAYRHSTFFGELGDAAQLTNAESRVASRRLQDIFSRNDEGQIVGFSCPMVLSGVVRTALRMPCNGRHTTHKMSSTTMPVITTMIARRLVSSTPRRSSRRSRVCAPRRFHLVGFGSFTLSPSTEKGAVVASPWWLSLTSPTITIATKSFGARCFGSSRSGVPPTMSPK